MLPVLRSVASFAVTRHRCSVHCAAMEVREHSKAPRLPSRRF